MKGKKAKKAGPVRTAGAGRKGSAPAGRASARPAPRPRAGAPDLAGRLAAHRFLHGLEAAHVAAIAACAREERFAPGAALLREGGVADRTFLVEQGQVALEVHAPGRGGLLVATAGPGEVVGWSWINAPSRWHMDARATDEVRALVLDGPRLVGRCEADPTLGWALAKRFLAVAQRRLVAMRLQTLDVYGGQA